MKLLSSIDITLLGMVLCLYLISGVINDYLPLVLIGLCLGFFTLRGKIILMSFVIIEAIYKIVLYWHKAPLLMNVVERIFDLKFFKLPDIDVPFYLPEVPKWMILILMVPLLIMAILITAFALISSLVMLPFYINQFVLINLICGGIKNVNECLFHNQEKLIMFARWYYILPIIEYLILIPVLSHYVFKRMGFYKRLPSYRDDYNA
jgi:hypothetical protein